MNETNLSTARAIVEDFYETLPADIRIVDNKSAFESTDSEDHRPMD